MRGRRKCPLARRGRVGDVTTWLSPEAPQWVKKRIRRGCPRECGGLLQACGLWLEGHKEATFRLGET